MQPAGPELTTPHSNAPHPEGPDLNGPDLNGQPLRFLSAYWTVWQGLGSRLQQAMQGAHDLDLRTFIVLSHLQAAPVTPSQLADTLDLPRYEVARVLRRLEERGALTRTTLPGDGRRHALQVTASGAALWRAALHTAEQSAAPAITALGPDLNALTAALERLTTLTHPEATP